MRLTMSVHLSGMAMSQRKRRQSPLTGRFRGKYFTLPSVCCITSCFCRVMFLMFMHGTGFFTLYLYATNGSPQHVVYALAGALCVIIPADILRLNFPAFERLYEAVLGFLMRDSEKVRTPALALCGYFPAHTWPLRQGQTA